MAYLRKKTLGRYGQPTQQTAQPYTFPACITGINAVDSLMQMPATDCIYTYNLMPAEYGMRLRKGYREWANNCIESPQRAPNVDVRTVIPFESNIQDAANDRLFAVTAEGIWDVTLFNTTTPDQVVTFTQTDNPAGFGVFTEFTGDAAGDGLRGHYLFYADGLNGIWQYEEATDTWDQPPSGVALTDWYYLDPADGTTSIAFPVDDVAFVMVHKQRIWVILEDEDDAWYLPVASVTGELKRFTFGSKLPHGGNLMGLYNWTVDGGDGVDDFLVCVSRGGDVILYQGDDPEIIPDGSSVGPWSTKGTWFIGEVPASRRLATAYGPDLFILSTFGLTSVLNLLQGTPIDSTSPSKKVNRFLRADVESGKDENAWQITVHPGDGFMQIITPTPSQTPYVQYNMNLQTAGWGFWEGVPILCGFSWNGEYYMGGEDGAVWINDGVLDGTTLANPNLWDTAVLPAPPAEWSEPVSDEYVCDGTQVADTAWVAAFAAPLDAAVTSTLTYQIKDWTAGSHWLEIDDVRVTPVSSSIGTFTSQFTAVGGETKISIAGDIDFDGTFFEVGIREGLIAGEAVQFRTLTSFQAPIGHSNFSRVGFIRTIGVLAGTAAMNVSAVYDYNITQPLPSPGTVSASGDNTWDSAIWDQDLWDFTASGKSFPTGALGLGRTFAVGLTGNSTTRLNIVGWDVLFTTGGFL